MSWSNKQYLVRSLSKPFRVYKDISCKSASISQRENDPEVFMRRITPQIIEVIDKDLGYKTPEEWDNSFYILGGGQSRRMSTAILARMTWDQFLYKFNEILENKL